MRSTILVLMSLFGALGLAAQEVIEQGYGIEVSPFYGSRRISGGANVIFTELERQDSIESGRAGYGIGFIYTSRVNKIGFTTGMRFLETGYDVEEQATGQPGETFTRSTTARYFSLPFELNFYQDITAKDRMFFALGIAGHFHLGTETEQTNFLDGEEVTTFIRELDPDERFRVPIISLNTSVGFDRKFSNRWSMRVEPYFQFFLQGNLINNFDQTNRNYYQLGGRILVRRAIL